MTAKIGNLKNPVRSSWIRELGCRLDAPPFVSGALEARKKIESLTVKKDELKTLVSSEHDGIFHAGRVRRLWVDGPDHGMPFLTTSNMLHADLSDVAFISNKVVAANPKLPIQPGWILVSRSGTIGRTLFVRSDLKGFAATEDVLRIIPNEGKVPSGYLYAFLCCRFGIPVVVAGTYGSIIQHLEPEHLLGLRIPRFGHALETRVNVLVQQAAAKRSFAAKEISQCASVFDDHIGDNETRGEELRCNTVSSTQIQVRMDASFHDKFVEDIRSKIRATHYRLLDSYCKRIFLPGIFKRIHVDSDEFGAPYFTGASLYRLEPDAKGILSQKTSLFDDVLLHYGTILVQAFGQEGGLTGRPVWVGRFLDQKTTTHMLARLFPNSLADAGLLFAFLSSQVGYQQVRVLPFGGSIPHFNESGIGSVLVPTLPEKTRKSVSTRILKALEARDKALDMELEGRRLVEQAIEENA